MLSAELRDAEARTSRAFKDFDSEGSVQLVQSSARWERALGGEGCSTATDSAHVRRPIRPGGLLGGVACAACPGRGPVRSGLSGSRLPPQGCPSPFPTLGMLLLALGGPWAAGLRLGGKRAVPWAANALRGRAAFGGGTAGLREGAPLLPRSVPAQVGGSQKGLWWGRTMGPGSSRSPPRLRKECSMGLAGLQAPAYPRS